MVYLYLHWGFFMKPQKNLDSLIFSAKNGWEFIWKLCFSCNEFFVKYQKNKPEIRAPHLNLALLRIIEFGGDLDLRFFQVVLTPKTGLCQWWPSLVTQPFLKGWWSLGRRWCPPLLKLPATIWATTTRPCRRSSTWSLTPESSRSKWQTAVSDCSNQ